MILNKLLSSKNNLHNHKNADTKNSKAQSFFKKLKAPFIVFIAILTIGTVYLGFTTNQAKADGETNNSSKETIIKKTFLNSINYCFTNDSLMPSEVMLISPEGKIIQNDMSQLFSDLDTLNGSKIILPNNNFISENQPDSINCYELFNGVEESSTLTGLYRQFNKNSFNITQMTNDGLGYDPLDNDENNCYIIKVNNVVVENGGNISQGNVVFKPICFIKNHTTINNLIGIENITVQEIGEETEGMFPDGTHTFISWNKIEEEETSVSCNGTDICIYWSIIESPNRIVQFRLNQNAEAAISSYNISTLNNAEEEEILYGFINTAFDLYEEGARRIQDSNEAGDIIIYYCSGTDDPQICTNFQEKTKPEFQKGYSTHPFEFSKIADYKIPYKFFSGTTPDDNNSNTSFNNEDRLYVLEYYLKKAIENNKLQLIRTESNCVEYTDMESDSYYMKITSGDLNGQWCKITVPDNLSEEDQYNIIADVLGENNQWLKQVNLKTVLEEYKKLIMQGVPPIGYTGRDYQDWNNPDQTEQSTTIITDRCMTEISLGWVFCHIMRFAANGADWLYNTIMADMLTMSPSYFQNNMIEDVWQTVTNIANVAMIVILLIIIFSQLTGIGIDNYGIKKTLPKLIIVAILINLSFIICKACIDISNILGNSLNDWLSNLTIGEEIKLADGSSFSSNAADSWFTVLFSTLTLGTGIFAGVSIKNIFTSEEGRFSSLFLPLLLLVLTAAFALLFLFLLLGLRQAGIIILVIAAPLAILCYTLPNTKKIYSKWFKSFQGLLILYPICGALIGGGTFISKLLVSLNPESYTMIFIGSIIMVVPFFLIPSLLKGSFKAMGNIGATVSGYGRRMRGWSTKRVDSGIRNSARFKRGVEQSRQLRQSIRDIKRGDRAEERVKRIGGFEKLRNDRQRLRYSEAIRAKNAATTKMAEFRNPDLILDETIAKNRRQSTLEAQEMRNHSERLSELTHDGIKAELNQAVAEYDPSNIQTRIRLQATIREAEKRSMNKEMLTSLNTLQLSAGESNGNDIKILDELAKSNNKIVSQYGKQMSKNPAENLSMEDFTKSNSAVKLSNALLDIGPNALNGIDDDTLDYLRSKNPNAITPDMIINGAASATNQKQIKQYNDLLANQIADPMKIKNIKLTGNQLAKLDESTARLLGAGAISDSDLRKQVIDASERILNSPELLSSLNPLAKKHINTVRTSAGMAPLP